MNLNLRQAIVQRVHDKSHEELADVIDSSIDSDERALPGLGVLFEMIWKKSDQAARDSLVARLEEQLRNIPANR